MVAPTQPQQQQPPPATAEEEALKRNTDCVYFLASPLTCKKGSECEYRHSEYARVNPRDCYYWLSGNCLNPKCSYRHPPLDGLFGTQAATSSGSSLPPSAVAPVTHAPHNSGKPAVPCIFFQKGLCLKGDRCAFLHGPNPTSNKVLQPMVPAPGAEFSPMKKALGGLQKCTQEQKIPIETPPVAKPAPKTGIAPPRNNLGVERNALQPKSIDVDVIRYKTTNLPPVVIGNSTRLQQSQVVDDHVFQNGKDGDDFLRESSPGFDVLVDDELRENDYYPGEDQYGRTRGPDGRSLNSVDEYGMGHSTDYNSVADIDQEYRDPRGYDSYEPRQGQYASWEQQRASPERMTVGPAHRERRAYSKADSPKRISESDLRYRLRKHRRTNGLRSVVSHDFHDNHVDERGYQGSSRRDSHRPLSQESSISSRLRGRIKLPRSPNKGSDLHTERGEVDRGRNWGRLSPGRSQISSQQGRLRDRIKARVEDEHNEGRNFRGPWMSREIMEQGSSDFAGPKSLAELKVVKNGEGRQQSLGKRKYVDDQPSEASLSFEGPMPLSEILKRKREAEAASFGGGYSSVKREDASGKASRENLISSSHDKAVAETHSSLYPDHKGEEESQLQKDNEQSKSAMTSAAGEVENTEDGARLQSSQLANPSELETEDGMLADEGTEEHEYEGDYQGDEEYEYEEGEEGDYTYEEGENVEEDYVEEEDGDGLGSNVGAMFS